eukprot:9046210-Pyramimonas_sp.AAC.1
MQPHRACAVDLMHALCSGIVWRLLSAILWRVILANPWELFGNKNTKIESAVKNIRTMMFEWQDRERMPWADRLGDLTRSTLGGMPKEKSTVRGVHVGQAVRLKAHESLIALKFAIRVGDTYTHIIPEGEHLMGSAAALWEVYSSLKRHPAVVPDPAIPQLYDLMRTCLLRAKQAGAHEVPKF